VTASATGARRKYSVDVSMQGLHLDVDAATADEAIVIVCERLGITTARIINGATFYVREVEEKP